MDVMTMTFPEYTLRKMEPRDLDEVHRIETTSSPTPWSKQMFIEEMDHPCASCFVMTSKEPADPHVIGFICFRNLGEESELLNICVHPGHRHLGVGRELMEFYTAYSLQRGMKTFHLEVSRANPSALRLYHFFSYLPVGVSLKFYRGEFDALRMMKRV
jgi:ribosomal-protein-alanine N-acetyltransferase